MLKAKLKVKQAANQLGVSEKLVYDMFGRGEIRGYRIGGAIRIPQEAIDEYLATHCNVPAAVSTAGAAAAVEAMTAEPATTPRPRTRTSRRGDSAGKGMFQFQHFRRRQGSGQARG